MAINLKAITVRLKVRLRELDAEDSSAAANTAPVTLDEQAVGRPSRMDELRVQAMALAARDPRTAERRWIQAVCWPAST